ncbi:uncharacterized protein [Panulirus ornatus]|uniref:uncharacterized protein n=1 Tax=Panulirus ornatus TaxID=150431 RepID=UPI003A84C1F8
MKKVLSTALSWDERINCATSYLDDILVDVAMDVEKRLSYHGLVCKLECGSYESRVKRRGIFWKRDNDIGEVLEKLRSRVAFSLCGRLTSHLPVCGWLCAAASYLKRRANAVTTSWDSELTNPELHSILAETLYRMKCLEPAQGRWNIVGDEAVVRLDASSLAIGAVLEVNDNINEDVCWLRQNECSHINLYELDAVLRGVNLAVAWMMERLLLMTDSKTMYYWLMDALSGRSRLKTKAVSEMLTRRVRVGISQVEDQRYLTLIDCGPSRYAIWRRLRRQDATGVIDQLESVFYERGVSKELLTDNVTSFRSLSFYEFTSCLGISVIYRCANVPSGNGIWEQCHRSVKTTAARKRCSVAEAVCYNVTPRGDNPSSNRIFRYEVRLLGIDGVSDHDRSDNVHIASRSATECGSVIPTEDATFSAPLDW